MEKLNNEQKLVLLLNRIKDSINTVELSNLLTINISWEKVIDYSTRNKTLNLLTQNMIDLGYEEYIPYYYLRLLKDNNSCTYLRNCERLLALEGVLKVFNSENIDLAIVKGAYLIDNLYQDRRVRTSNDIDGLIRKKDIKKIDNILKELGYINGEFDFKNNAFIFHYITFFAYVNGFDLISYTPTKWEKATMHLLCIFAKI